MFLRRLHIGETIFFLLFVIFTHHVCAENAHSSNPHLPAAHAIPKAIEEYDDAHYETVHERLLHRIKETPFNLVATCIFFLAVIHMLCAHKFEKLARGLEKKHRNKNPVLNKPPPNKSPTEELITPTSFKAQISYFGGQVEVIFMIWVIPLTIAITLMYNWDTAIAYVNSRDFKEALFVVAVMALTSTRPVLNLAELALEWIASLFGNSPMVYWFTIITLGPILGSIITEPGAITISALLLSRQFYRFNPSPKFAYATIGLLFVNISVGGVLTHFAAPPVLMVSHSWNWDSVFMFTHFGWKAILGILFSNILYAFVFRSEFAKIKLTRMIQAHGDRLRGKMRKRPSIPLWIFLAHLLTLYWIITNEMYPVIFIGTFLLFMGFYQATRPHQTRMSLKPPILVGCFLGGLIVHGGLQGWWIEPILSGLSNKILMLCTVGLTAFNDNASITYLSTLNPNINFSAQYAIVAGAIAGGGLTVMANAPNPAGQLLLEKHFYRGISAISLLLGALVPTIIQVTLLMFLP